MEASYETDVQHFQDITANYEKLVSELSNELKTVKAEQDTLRLKVSSVLNENNRLSKQIKELTHIGNQDSSLQSELVKNLQQQIVTLSNEKEEITKLWQHSRKSLEILENELKIFQTGSQDFVPKSEYIKVKQNYEERIKILNIDLNSTKAILEETMRNTSKELTGKYQEIDQSLENQASALKIVKNLEDEVLILQSRLQDFEKEKTKLQKTLKNGEDMLQKLTKKNVEYRDKVAEAVQVVEAALHEKDAALFRETEMNIKIEKINEDMKNIMKEMEEKVTNQVEAVKLEYNKRYEVLMAKYNTALEDLKVKSLEIEKFSAKCSFLENEMEKFRRGDVTIQDTNISKLLILEKNLETTFQKLLVSEKVNIQLASEKETIKNDMEQLAGHYERTLKTKEVEKLTLQNKIKQLESYLEEKDLTLKRSNEKLNLGEEEKIEIQKNFKQQLENQEKLMAQVQADKIFEITTAYTERMNQLQNQLDSKDKLSHQWRNETKIIIEKLEKVVGDLKAEVRKLKKDNLKLKEELDKYKNKFEQYRSFLQIISQDVNKISYKAFNKDQPG
nr:hyaluronan-mediated motility receptor-like [Leptinotarsa decemlineata]